MTSPLKFPPGMRRIAKTGAIVLDRPITWPLAPADPRFDAQLPEGGIQRERFRAAQQALDRLASGWLPGDAELTSAPLLDHWAFFVNYTGDLLFTGTVTGHPRIADGRICVTSPVIAYDGLLALWIRTISRWYRLGRPYRADNVQ